MELPIKRPLILAHRGAKADAPENTLAAFQLAVQQGSDGVELDIHLTLDNHIVVCHDCTVDRTTNGTGIIRQMTLDQIRKLDAGSWYHESFSGEKIPTLEEVLDLLPDHYLVNIEVKEFYDGAIVEPLLKVIRSYRFDERFVLSSFDHKCMKYMKLIDPRLRIGLLYSNNMVDPVGYSKLLGVEVYSLHPMMKWITAEEAAQAEKEGMPVYTYTVNEEEQMRQAIAKRLDGIITDYPGRLKKVIEELM